MGCNINQLLLQNGISPTILRSGKARVTFEQFSRLSLALVELLDDENYGLATKPQRSGTFKLACYSALHAETIGEAIEIFAQFNNVLEMSLEHEISIKSDVVRYQFRRRPSIAIKNSYLIEHSLVVIHRTLCWMANSRIPLLQVDLDYPEPAFLSEYKQVFYGAPVRFGQPANVLYLSSNALKLQNVRNLPQLRDFLKQTPLTLLSQTIREKDLCSQVRRWLEREISKHQISPSFETAAAHFELHPQSFRRKLKQAGSSYQDIKMDVRRGIAINLIGDPRLSVEAISYQLDFSEPSAFIRAFKGWTGLTPLAYRRLNG